MHKQIDLPRVPALLARPTALEEVVISGNANGVALVVEVRHREPLLGCDFSLVGDFGGSSYAVCLGSELLDDKGHEASDA